MKWVSNKLTREEQNRLERERLSKWHNWFAWFPVTVDYTENNRKIKVWLQPVWRKAVDFNIRGFATKFMYREKENEEK